MRSIPWKQLLISIGIIAVIVSRVPFAGLRGAFQNLGIANLALALYCFAVLLFVRAYKWHRLLETAGKSPLRRSLRALFGGFALGLITPGRLGELGRCVFVRQNERAQVALFTLLDRLLDFWALLTLMGVSLFLLASFPAAIFGVALWLASLPVVMGFPALVAHLSKRAQKSRHFRAHWVEGIVDIPRIPTTRYAILALLAMGVELASFFFLLRAFSPTRFTSAVATYPYIVLAGDLPVSFSGVGVREGVAALLLSPYAVSNGAAVDASLMWFVFAMLLPAVLGAAWLIVERLKWRKRTVNQVSMLISADPASAAGTECPNPSLPESAQAVEAESGAARPATPAKQ